MRDFSVVTIRNPGGHDDPVVGTEHDVDGVAGPDVARPRHR
jgi:hypothetical protein